jgi:hypothetical protein
LQNCYKQIALITYRGNTLKKIAILTVIAMGISACGGGGGGSDAAATTAVVGPLTKYEGTWGQGCDSHERTTYNFTASNGGTSLAITEKSEYFDNAGCTGAIVATGTYSRPEIVAQYNKTEANAPVKMLTGQMVTGSVDVVTAEGSGEAINFTGSGVTSSVVNGKTVWHIVYNGGSNDLTVDIKTGSQQGGLLLLNGELLELDLANASATSFNVNSRYIR